MADDNYEKVEQYIIARLKQGAAPETIKSELRTRNINPEMVDYALKRMQSSNSKGKDGMQYAKVFGVLVLVIILLGVGVYYYNTSLKKEQFISKPRLFAASFESGPSDSTIINATSTSSYSYRDYNNVPEAWKIKFVSSGEFKWDDHVSHSGTKSIRLNNPGGIIAQRKIRLTENGTQFVLNTWVKSNNLKTGFAFTEIDYEDSGNNSVLLNRSGKIIGSNDWSKIKLRFSIPSGIEEVRIKFALLNRDERLDLYGELQTLLDGTAEVNGAMPSEAVWFDDVSLKRKS